MVFICTLPLPFSFKLDSAVFYSMKISRPINWYVWRKERLNKSLFFFNQTNTKIPYAQTKLLACSDYLLSNFYLTCLSNKTNTSLSANTLKARLDSVLSYSFLVVWLNYNLCTKFHLYIGYSLVRTLRVGYGQLNYWPYSRQISNSKQVRKLPQIRYYGLNRNL